MDPNNFGNVDSINSGMTAFPPYGNLDINYLNNHGSGNINGAGQLHHHHSVSGTSYGPTNTYPMPASSILYQTGMHAYQNHQHNQLQNEQAATHLLNQQFHHPLGHQYAPFDFNNLPSQSYLLHGSPMQPSASQYDNSALSGNLGPFNGASNLDMIPTRASRDDIVQSARFWTGEPYAKLIYEALKIAPHHRMVLRDIYKWFELNTDKSQASKGGGWKNSIRHNLSMNWSFHKVDVRNEANKGKKSYIWALRPSALVAGGVESTTRYRKNAARKNTKPQAQRRGSKKGQSPRSSHDLSQDAGTIVQHAQDKRATAVKEERRSHDLSAASQHSSSNWSMQVNAEQCQFPYRQHPLPWQTNSMIPQSNTVEAQPDGFPGFDNLAPPFHFDQQGAYVPTQPNTPAVNQDNSPTPSMTATMSSFGYHEDNELERLQQFSNQTTVQHNQTNSQYKYPESAGPFVYQEEDVAPTIEN